MKKGPHDRGVSKVRGKNEQFLSMTAVHITKAIFQCGMNAYGKHEPYQSSEIAGDTEDGAGRRRF